MKNNNRFFILAGVLAMGWASCEKTLLDGSIPQSFPDNNATAYVKFLHAYAGKAPALTTGAGPSVYLYLGTQKINASGLSFTGSGGAFPTPSTATTNTRSWYVALPAGGSTLYGVMARNSASPSVPAPVAGDTVFKSAVNLQAGKSYSAFLSDTAQTPSITLLEDNYGEMVDGKYKLRLANFLAWPGDVQEIYSTREGRVVQGNITYKTAGQFIELPVPKISDTLIIRKVSGSSPGTYSTTINGFFPVSKRAYTFFTRGKQITGTSAVFQNYGVAWTTNY